MKRQDSGPDRQGVVGLVVDGAAGADFGADFLQFEREDGSCLHFLFVGPADFFPTTFHNMLGEDAQSFHFFGGLIDEPRGAENNDRTVVDGVVEGGAGQNEAVNVGDGDADRNASAECFEHAAGGAAVKVEGVATAAIVGRDDVGLAIDGEAHVADEGRVEDLEDGLFVIVGALGEALHLCAVGGLKLGHRDSLGLLRRVARAKLAVGFADVGHQPEQEIGLGEGAIPDFVARPVVLGVAKIGAGFLELTHHLVDGVDGDGGVGIALEDPEGNRSEGEHVGEIVEGGDDDGGGPKVWIILHQGINAETAHGLTDHVDPIGVDGEIALSFVEGVQGEE